MFRKDLQERLSEIFGMRKTTFDAPGEHFEQDTLFIEVSAVNSRTSQGKAFAKVTGQLLVFSENNKLPYGFFNKRVAQAKSSLKKGLFFFNIDQDALNSEARTINITERRTGFVFLWEKQYDPNQGSLTTVEETIGFIPETIDVAGGALLDTGDEDGVLAQ